MYGRARLVRRVQRRFRKTIMRCWRRVIWVRSVRRVSLTQPDSGRAKNQEEGQ